MSSPDIITRKLVSGPLILDFLYHNIHIIVVMEVYDLILDAVINMVQCT